MTRQREAVAAVFAVAFLNTLLTLQNIWPTLWVRPTLELSVELAVLLVVLAAAVGLWGGSSVRLRWSFTAVFLLLVAGRYADITAPALFGRRVDLFWDAPHLPRVVAMVAESMPTARFALYTLLAVALVAVLTFAVSRAAGVLTALSAHTGPRRAMAGSAAALLCIYGAGIGSPTIDTERWFALPVTPVYAEQAAFLVRAARAAPPIDGALSKSDLSRLRGGDVYLMYLESYGSGVFETPRMREALADDFAALETFAARSGWRVASGYLESPTFGGASWRAHATVLSGRWIDNEADYRAFLANPPETLVDRFRSAGYRSVALLPGIKLDWPEGAALRFDRILDARALDYGGPAFGWWTIPDQFSLETLYRREMVQADRKPLFVQFASITSHMPFGPTPPYQTDWDRMGAADPYDPEPLASALAEKPDWSDITTGYVKSIRYDLQLIQGFLDKRVPENALVVVSGDHQPPAIVSGDGADWSVPVHVFSRSPALIERFRAAGFRSGLQPSRPTLARMDEFTTILLRALDSGAALASR